MDQKLEKHFRERAVELGNSGDPSALLELIKLAGSPAANVRRLAASAIGKLAGLVDAGKAIAALVPMLRDAKPQVRQYAVRALSEFSSAAKCALPDLRDMAISPVEKGYNNAGAKRVIGVIEEACRIAEASGALLPALWRQAGA
jgi:HEAT repeat protein